MNLRHSVRTATLGVAADDRAGYVAAVAELPISTHTADSQTADIVVLDGRSHTLLAAVHAAVERGVRGIVVHAPGPLTPAEADDLADASTQVPLVADRPLLARDLADTVLAALGDHATAPARAAVASASAPPGQRSAVLRDLLGWVRELAGPDLRVVGSHSGRDALGAHLVSDGPEGPRPAVVGIHTAQGSATLRIDLTGEVCARLAVDREVQVEIQAESGLWSPPLGHESRERRVLRRIATALAGGEYPADAHELAADTALLRSVERP